MPLSTREFGGRALAAFGAAVVAFAALSPARAESIKPAFMPVGEAIEPPFGYFDYCRRTASGCVEFGSSQPLAERAANSSYWDLVFETRAQPAKAASASWVVADLTAEKWREIAEINRRVNGEILAFSDQRQFGRDDFWAVPRLRGGRMEGDCEDYVLQKRLELIEAGVPEAALSIAIAKTRRRQVHAVLLIATPRGEYVLDNRSAWISPWYDVNYRWERRQVPGSKAWVKVASHRPWA